LQLLAVIEQIWAYNDAAQVFEIDLRQILLAREGPIRPVAYDQGPTIKDWIDDGRYRR
jgi:hypothetical protein